MPPSTNATRPSATLWIAGAAVALAAAALLVRLLPDTAPDSDFAVIDLAVYRVLHGWQAVGPYSRFGWSHPGPLYFQLLAPLYWLGGLRHFAIDLTVAVINAASLIGIAAILKRHSPAMLLAAVPWFIVYLVRLDGLLASPWNPYVPMLPFALLLASATASAAGAFRLLPLVVGLACFVIQTHVGFGAAAMAILGTTSTIIAVEAWRESRTAAGLPRSLARQIAIALSVGVALWAVPVIDEIRPGGQHNLRAVGDYLREAVPHDPRLSARAFEHMLVAPFTPSLKLWGNTPLPDREPRVRLISQIQTVALVAAAIVFFVRGRRFERSLALILMAANVAGLVAARRLPEVPQEHTILWATVLGLMTWTLISTIPVAAASRWIARTGDARWIAAASWLTPALVVAVVTACVRDLITVRAQEVRASLHIEQLSALAREKIDRAGTREPFIRVPEAFWGVSTGVVLQLRRAGLHPHVNADWVSMFGADCAPTGREPVTIAFARPDDHNEDMRYRSNYERLGRVEDVFVYGVDPAPPSAVVSAPVRVIDHSPRVNDPNRVSDDTPVDAAAGASSPRAVIFSSAEEFVTIELPATRLAGVRVWGEPGSTWQLRCAGSSAPDFARIGQVRVDDGEGTRSGESFLWSLEGCRQLKIAPVTGHEFWLSKVQLLSALER